MLQKTKQHIGQHHVNIVEGYIRKIKSFVPQQIVDLILFFYAKPKIMNVRYQSKTNSVGCCPIDTAWDVLESRILQSFGLSKWNSLIRLNHKHETITRYNWESCRWFGEHTFECDIKLYNVTTKHGKMRKGNLPMAPTIEQFDDALARYYNLMGSEYANQFSEYCEENGFDDLAEEMCVDPLDCMLVDFDEDIPFKFAPWYGGDVQCVNKTKAIFELLLTIYYNPDCDFQQYDNECIPLQINEEDFKIKAEDIKQVRAIYSKQLVTLFTGEMKDDENILTLLAISEKRKVPYFSYLFDMFSRDRISAEIIDDRCLMPSDWVSINKHCLDLKTSISTKAKDIVQHAIMAFFYQKSMTRLMFSTDRQIMDDLEMTAKYISTQIDFVHNLAQKGNGTCPFQLDALIAYNKVKHVEQNVEICIDELGDVKTKLKCEGLLHEIGVIDNETKDYEICYQKFKQEQIKKKYNDQEFEKYPYNHRFCSLIDRRKPNKYNNNGVINKDEIIFFEPPYNCNTIPNDARTLWYFDSLKTSFIPNIGYCKNKGAYSEININSTCSTKGALVFISFHVLSVNEIRAYLYLNGQMTRFFPSDIIDLLPRYFHSNENNKRFIKSQVAKDLIVRMKTKLRDLKFEAFYNEFKYGT